MAKTVLVSRANGFIAAHAVEKLLARADKVVGTVRNPADAAKTGFLREMPGAEAGLTLVAADLNDADPFSAHADVDAILHIASPYVIDVKDAQRDLIDPAVEGTLSMLSAAAKNLRVKRVVLTSSMAAITDNPDGRVLTEADWNTQSSLNRNPYYYSKTLAERAAWDFMETVKPRFDLIVINPFMVVGPAHSVAVNTSNQIFADFLAGKYPAIMAIEWGFVDVRDVADAHLAALDKAEAKGRYVCASGNMDMEQIVALMPAEGYKGKLPSMNLSGNFGTAMMKLASYAQPVGVGSFLRTHLGRAPRFDNSKIRRELGFTFRTPEQSMKDSFADLERWGHIRKG